MSEHQHFALNKPAGYLSQFITNQTKRRNKKLLGDLYDFPANTMAIGRLDENSEGLLLLTTDGKMSELVRSAKVEKEYYVQVDGIITQAAVGTLKDGCEISVNKKTYLTKPCQAKTIDAPALPPASFKIRDERHGPTSWISITITEGKFRQVRKMTAAVGFPTLRLVRVRIGSIHLKELVSGEVVAITLP